jgi:alkylhydroperoxidase family enzyme
MTGRPRATNTNKPTGNMIRDSALGLVPETLDYYMALNRTVWECGPLTPAEIEIARLRNARTVNCVFCKSVRYDIAKADGLTEQLKAELLAEFTSEALVHLSLVVAHFSGFSRCAVSLGGMPDELPIIEMSVPQ